MAIATGSSSLLKTLLNPKKNVLAAMHKSSVDHRLRRYVHWINCHFGWYPIGCLGILVTTLQLAMGLLNSNLKNKPLKHSATQLHIHTPGPVKTPKISHCRTRINANKQSPVTSTRSGDTQSNLDCVQSAARKKLHFTASPSAPANLTSASEKSVTPENDVNTSVLVNNNAHT